MSTESRHVLAKALAGDAVHAGDEPELERLLDIAEAEIRRHGFARTSLNDIARKAGVSRPTAYRRLGNKDLLLQRLLVRATATFFAEFESAVTEIHDVAGRAAEAVVVGLRTARVHPLAGDLLAYEPETMQPTLTGEGPTLLRELREPLTRFLDPEGTTADEATARAGEMLIRLATSFLLTPSDLFDLEDDDQIRTLARGAIEAAMASAGAPR